VRLRRLVWILGLALLIACGGDGVIDDDDTSVNDDDTVNDDDAVDDDDTTDDDDATADDDDSAPDDDDSAPDDDDSAPDDDDVMDDDDIADDDDVVDDDDIADDDDVVDDDDIADDDDVVDDDDIADDDDATAGMTFDCATAPTSAGLETIIPGAVGYHGLAIDPSGLIVGSDGTSLIKSDYAGNWSLWLPGLGGVEQLAYMTNGDLAYALLSDGGIHTATPAGGQSLLASNQNAYGVIIGPNGQVWTAGWNGTVDRIRPGTGVVTTIANIPTDSPHSIGFNLDYSKLYIGTVGSGAFYVQDLDAGLNPVGAPTVFTWVGGGWHDAVAVDICGYIYVPDYWNTGLYRVDPTTGVSILYADWSSNSSYYGHGAIWGTGIGGWRDDALYVPMPYGGYQVREVLIGVPGRDWPGTAINLP
jgi:hypothetical protein